MSTYKNLIGKDVNFLTTDPDNDAAEGQIWYNSTSNVFKDLITSEAWASTGSLSTARGFVGSTGTQTAALCIGGLTTASPPIISNVEEYNGAGWSAGGSLPAETYGLGAAGTQTAALIFGGSTPSAKVANSYTYNGSSWTATPNSMNTARDQVVGGGTQTSALAVGGRTPPAAMQTNLEEWNGTSWSNLPAISQARGYAQANGPETAFFIASGAAGPNGGEPYTNETENYDGTSLSTGSNVNTARGAGGAAGNSANALIFGGSHPGSPNLQTEKYDGTSWSETADLATVKKGAGSGSGTVNTAAIAAGNYGPPPTTTSEEFTQSVNVITAAAWASGGALPSPGRQGYGVGTGTQTASIIAGGPPDSTQNQFYDGSSWTNLASIPSGVTNSQGFGDSEELLMAGGNTGAPYSALTYVYSRPGNSWTAVSSPGNINTARGLGAGCGALSTAGIIAGGDIPGYTTATESWNGSTWTTVNALPTATGNGVGSCGTQTAGLIWSGQNPGDPTAEETYEWDGTNWTSSGNRLIGVRAVRGGAGTQTAALTFGGWLDPGGSVSTEGYDGTSWSTRPNMAGAAANNFQTGTQTAALRAGGTDGPGYTAVEEFTGETTALNIKTITTS